MTTHERIVLIVAAGQLATLSPFAATNVGGALGRLVGGAGLAASGSIISLLIHDRHSRREERPL